MSQPPFVLPAELQAAVAGYRWSPVTEGESGAAVFRLTCDGDRPVLYLKTATDSAARDLADESARLRWLATLLPTAKVVYQSTHGPRGWLLMTAVPGQSMALALAHAGAEERRMLVDALAAFLRRLQAIPSDACPFPADPGTRLAQARRRIDAGLVDPEDFDDDRSGWTAEQVWDALQAAAPTTIEPVVAHGDFTLENVLCDRGAVSGCIDVGRLGVADRHQDIALAWRGLGEFGPDLQQRFLTAMGSDPADPDRLEFHLLLDELF